MTVLTRLNAHHLVVADDDATREIVLDRIRTLRPGDPGRTAPAFDLNAFTRALEQRDLDYQLSCYVPYADIRIVDPNNPVARPWKVRGVAAIRSWLLNDRTPELDFCVTRQVDAVSGWPSPSSGHCSNGTDGQAISTAELAYGLISTQHTIFGWGALWS